MSAPGAHEDREHFWYVNPYRIPTQIDRIAASEVRRVVLANLPGFVVGAQSARTALTIANKLKAAERRE